MGFFDFFLGNNKKETSKEQIEDYYEVEINDFSIKVKHPKRYLEEINWDEIEEIKIVNTDEGPFLPDVWLLLIGKEKKCSIPQGSKGWDEVYDIISKYEGFDFENVIQSATCTENKTFEIWKKK